MNYLQVDNISKSYGDKTLFQEVSLLINQGDKIALIAKNGTGKSTFLRVLAGLEAPEGEKAKMLFRTGIKIVFLDQEPYFEPGVSVMDAIFDVDDPKVNAIRNYETALIRDDAEKMKQAMAILDDLKAWDMEVKIKETLGKLRIHEFDKIVDELSGGQKKRLALAKVLIQEPDFIILDEPTNHLDLDMIEWLENFLSQSKVTILMVTHDRYFLENVCNRIIELDNGNFYTYSGNYEDYLLKKVNRVENESVVADKNKKLLKKELNWLSRQPKARTTKGKARIDKTLDLKDEVDSYTTADEMSINIEPQRLGGKIVEFHNVSKSFGDLKIIENFSYKFKKKEKLGIVGPNGAGKSSLINLMTGMLNPDGGKMVIGETVVFGYFTQDGLQIKNDKRVIEVIRDIAEYLPMAKGMKMSAEQLLERFLFPRKQQQVYVSQLSGGEKRRLHLLTILMKNPNFLILDEPTNDLDILTLNVLEDYLMQYQGCLVMVSHDRYFMDKLVDHLFVMEGDGFLKDYNGNYSRYRREKKENLSKEKPVIEKVKPVEDSEELRKERKKMKNELNRVEKELEKLEEEKTVLADYFNRDDIDPENIASKSQELKQTSDKIDILEARWEELVEKME
jgi:ATP-binding cassette subfamily F protein uup